MYVDDLAEYLRVLLVTNEMGFLVGWLRVELILFCQVAGVTGNRPDALTQLRYRDLELTLVRDPHSSAPRLCVGLTAHFTKTFLGMKDANTFWLPEIIYDPTLVLSPHIFLLGMLFHIRAFKSPGIRRPEDLYSLGVLNGLNQQELPLRDDLADLFVFCSAVREGGGVRITHETWLTTASVRARMKKGGEITGFHQVTKPYVLRDAAANGFNESPDVSDSLQNLMLQHASIDTFLKHYLDRNITADVLSIYRGLEPQEALMRMVCSMSRSVDPRRPWKLTPEQSRSVPRNPLTSLQHKHQNQKRSREVGDPLPAEHIPKRRRTSRAAVGDTPVEHSSGVESVSKVCAHNINLIDYWRKEGRWPKGYFERGSNMSLILARKKSTSPLRRKQSESSSLASSTTLSDQKPREAEKQSIPIDSLFRDDLFDKLCEMIQDRNETRVIRDISQLIVPSAELLATYGAIKLICLIESVNEGWENSIPVTGPRPQPDYSVGFRRSAFTDDQLKKIQPFVGELTDTSYFMATYYMYFPFLTCEVKCGAAALDIADRQNAHSATIAARATVELFKLVKREKEIDREILAFSVSHDHTAVRIYGHYAVLEGEKTNFYRHPIHKFDFTALDGKEKWTAYKFTRNVYDIWMPTHFKRICSAIDQIPLDVDFDVSQSELQYSQQSNSESVLAAEDDDSQPSQRHIASAGVTPTTSFTEQTQIFKRPRKKQ
ncbi:hypothetical protein ACJ73_00338 [Blastomyces percursus]|uniref:DUF7924 domain-containing protein n=1 Tax=Blastomyces percursus TaxID=1658174 RepID=A0A1J9R794_9EURO|nr:hypothetical protein ACJ73_00338 [Blastomyces percursus]